MMRRAIIIPILSLCCAFTYAQQNTQLINYGVKGGFSSTVYNVNEFIVASIPIHNYVAKSEISLFYTAFARVNIKRHYLQTEVSYNISKYSIDFKCNIWNPIAESHDKSTFSTKIVGIEIPLYYGYHILKEGPYGLSVYAGPKTKFVLTNRSKHTFDNFPYNEITEHIYPINFSLMAGLGINISRVFFDFSFETGLHNISKGFITDNGNPNDLIFNRRKNVLSFSIGFML